MVHISEIEARLNQLGVNLSRWFRAEKKELQHILMDHEKIICAVPGRYYGSFALLVATDQRLLLIDKRTFFMNLEDIRYDMITETNFNTGVIEATLQVYTLNKHHQFTSIKNKDQLRDLTKFVQRRVMEIRQYQASPEMSLMQTNPGERYAAQPPMSRPSPDNQPSLAVPAPSQQTNGHQLERSRSVGTAALTAARRFRPFSGGQLSMHSSVFMGSSNLFQED